jgi:hypothetical protein
MESCESWLENARLAVKLSGILWYFRLCECVGGNISECSDQNWMRSSAMDSLDDKSLIGVVFVKVVGDEIFGFQF